MGVFVGFSDGMTVRVAVVVSVKVIVGVNVEVLVAVAVGVEVRIYSLILSGNNPHPNIRSTMKPSRTTGKNLENHFINHSVKDKTENSSMHQT